MDRRHADLRPGDQVRFRLGATTIRARVIEDRGHVGVNGRQIVRIEVLVDDADEGDEQRFEMPADDLVREAPAV